MGAPSWRRLHKQAHAATTLGAVHWAMLAEDSQREPLLYRAAVALALAARLDRKHVRTLALRKRMAPPGTAGLGRTGPNRRIAPDGREPIIACATFDLEGHSIGPQRFANH